MARQKQPKGVKFDLSTALYTADSYMIMADRAVSELRILKTSDLSGNEISSAYLAISSFAFSLEIYLKSVTFALDERCIHGHDLELIWGKLEPSIREWLDDGFKYNYESDGKDWSAALSWNPFSGASPRGTFQTPNSSAAGIIEGHRRAFEIGRYGYEIPPPPDVKIVMHNIPGLQLLCWLARKLAYHCVEKRRAAMEAVKQIDWRHPNQFKIPGGTAQFKLPDWSVERFPLPGA